MASALQAESRHVRLIGQAGNPSHVQRLHHGHFFTLFWPRRGDVDCRAGQLGRLLDPAAEWEMPLTSIRQAISKHESSDRLKDCLHRLMHVMVNVVYVAEDRGDGPEQRVVITGLFDFFDVSARELAKRATLKYGLPRKLAPILASSGRWGRIKAEIVCSMTSKYGIALYELVQLKANMERCVETVSMERLRELMGVPPGKYERVDNLMRKVIDPAMLQVNKLSDMSVAIEPRRRHSRAPVHEFDLAWWRKQGDELRDAIRERNRPKFGRMARLRGQVEQLAEDRLGLVNAEVAEKLERMRAEERAKVAAAE
jgi:hypothetical protein